MDPIKTITFHTTENAVFCKELDLLVIAGSRLYGLETDKSDYDYVGVVLPPQSSLFSLHPFEHAVNDFKPPFQASELITAKAGTGFIKIDFNTDSDKPVNLKVYSLNKFFKMLMNKDVSSFEILFSINTVNKTELGLLLQSRRRIFLSKNKIYDRFRGYAENEKRVTLGVTTGTLGEARKYDLSQYGYSMKNAANCIRLLIEGILLLSKGDTMFPFDTETLALLKFFRTGAASVADFNAVYESKIKELEEAYCSSKLPDKIDFPYIDDFYRSLCIEYS